MTQEREACLPGTGAGYHPAISSAPSVDLSAIPEDEREAVLAALRERDALREANKRLEHLVTELNQFVHGKKSERLSEDDRQMALEDPETAFAEVEAQQTEVAPASSGPRRTKTARRNRGDLPEGLPRIEQVIEPASLECPCGCGSMHRIGVVLEANLWRDDRSGRLEIVPAQLRVIL
ncbi:hypothetical protein [Pseudooceanicola sp. HF7]|uniref:IS66 family transposase n=1 Tax=Pseudooceanicola sp. HF7 TaxID=2721560 RepID=UPI001C37D801|nr:hypothetical protein [Pseudooceanicola sp. HF7]